MAAALSTSGTAAVHAMVTTQGTVADPEHRSGVGTFILPSDAPAPERPVAVFAALPTRTSATTPNAVDTLVVVGAGWPDDTSAVPPTIVMDDLSSMLQVRARTIRCGETHGHGSTRDRHPRDARVRLGRDS